MSSGDPTLPAARRSRKSIGSMTRKTIDKENSTIDVISNLGANRKKSRSKSIGPGGLDALKQGTGNRRASLAVPARPRSILKPSPSIPEIPPHSRKKANGGSNVFSINGDLLSNVPEPSFGSKVALRTEEEQQKAAREREEWERRDARRKSLANRRVSFAAEATLHTFHDIEYMQDSTASSANSRKSGVDRSTDRQEEQPKARSRRSSTGIQPMHSRNNNDDDTLASTTYGSSDSELIEEVEEDSSEEEDSDADDGTMMSVEVEEMTSASVGSLLGSPQLDQDESDTLEEALREAARKAGTQRLGNEEEEEEEIIPSFGWAKKPAAAPKPQAPASRPTVDDQTRTMDMDMDMDMDMTTPIGSILQSQGAVKSQHRQDQTQGMDLTIDVTQVMGGILARQMNEPLASDDHDYSQSEATMEFTTALGNIKGCESLAPSEFDANEDMSMELTTVMGSVLSQQASSAAARRQETLARVQQENAPSSPMQMDMDMEMTAAVGRILRNGVSSPVVEDDEDGGHTMTMGMDITQAVGRILGTTAAPPPAFAPSEDETFGMEMTTLGNILSSTLSAPEPQVEHISDEPLIDLSISSEKLLPAPKPQEPQQDAGITTSPYRATSPARSYSSSPFKSPTKSPPGIVTQTPSSAQASAPVIPGLEPRMTRSRSRSQSPEKSSPTKPKAAPRTRVASKSPRKSLRKNAATLASTTPQVPPPMPLILDIVAPSPGLLDLQASIPTMELPQSSYPPATPIDLETPPALQGGRQTSRSPSGSPSLLRAHRQSTAVTARPARNSTGDEDNQFRKSGFMFQKNPDAGTFAPVVVLTPKNRRMSRLGADRPGIGSPKISAILDKRNSLRESISSFPPPSDPAGPKKGVAFESPKVLEREMIEEEVRENARRMAQREAEGSEATLNLRDMIKALSPKKRTISRKSLHVGSARGLLGKRPAELDSDEEDESRDGVKRLKGLVSSPVKAIRLQKPPSKEVTAAGRALFESPEKTATKPKEPTPKKNMSKFATLGGSNGEVTQATQSDSDQLPELQPNDAGGNRIHLHEFLEMTTIRFVEMDATKKRHTIAPGRFGSTLNLEADMTLERCVVAGACTVPMLELYQHSCRELKKYISEGRRIVREIETETFDENPPLFREYMSATLKMKKQMDDQFKNVKTHARLLSKAMWYEWRMKLQDGIKEGLVQISEGMDSDVKIIEKQEKLISSVLPGAQKRKEELTQERENLQRYAEEISACDPTELQATRDDLVSVTSSIAAKRREIEALKCELEETEAGIAATMEHKRRYQDAIVAAERTREECRGWSTKEVATLKLRTTALEKKYGWSITGVSGSLLTMTYLQDLSLSFDAAVFCRSQRNAPIDISYIGHQRRKKPHPETPERTFFIQCLRDYLQSLTQSRTQIGNMLQTIATTWQNCLRLSDDLRITRTTFPTIVTLLSNGTLTIQWTLLIRQLETRVEMALELSSQPMPNSIEIAVAPRAEIVYGEPFNTGKMVDFWKTKVGGTVGEAGKVIEGEDEGEKRRWVDVLVDLQGRLLARGRKGAAREQAV